MPVYVSPLMSGTGFFRGGIHIEAISVSPAELLTNGHMDRDIRFGRHYGSHSPQAHVCQRSIASNQYTRAGLLILDPDLVIGRVFSESREFGIERVTHAQIFRKQKLLPTNLAQPAHVLCCAWAKWKTDHNRWSGLQVINAQKIVVVNHGLDHSFARVQESVLDFHQGLALQKANRLFVPVSVSRTALQFLSKLNPICTRLGAAFAAVYDRIVCIRTVGLVIDLAQRPNADLAERFSRLRLRVSQSRSIRSNELLDRPAGRAVDSCLNRICDLDIRDRSIELLEERREVVMPLVLKAADHTRPVEPGAPIESLVRLR